MLLCWVLRLLLLRWWRLLVVLWLLPVVWIRWRRLLVVGWRWCPRRTATMLLLLLLHRHHHARLHHRLLLGSDATRHGVVPHHRIVVVLLLHRRNHWVEVSGGHPILPKLTAKLGARRRNSPVLSLVMGGVGHRVLGMVRLVGMSLVRHCGGRRTGLRQ